MVTCQSAYQNWTTPLMFVASIPELIPINGAYYCDALFSARQHNYML